MKKAIEFFVGLAVGVALFVCAASVVGLFLRIVLSVAGVDL